MFQSLTVFILVDKLSLILLSYVIVVIIFYKYHFLKQKYFDLITLILNVKWISCLRKRFPNHLIHVKYATVRRHSEFYIID